MKSTTMNLPASFENTVLNVYGEKGRSWLGALPGLIEGCCDRWSIQLVEVFPLSFNYVAAGVRADGIPVVFKAGVPDAEMVSGIAALHIYNGQGVVKLLDEDLEHGAMLLERVIPGRMLSDLPDDEENTRILARQMQRIWRPLSSEQVRLFPSLDRWTKAYQRLRKTYQGDTGPFPETIFNQAEVLLKELLASQGEAVLLHGDLHHDNILSAVREPWLVIDPKGVAGEREFEIGPLFYNPWQRILSWPDLRAILSRRVDVLVEELGSDRQKLLGWAFVEVVLSMLWSLEDHSPNWDDLIPIAEILSNMIANPVV